MYSLGVWALEGSADRGPKWDFGVLRGLGRVWGVQVRVRGWAWGRETTSGRPRRVEECISTTSGNFSRNASSLYSNKTSRSSHHSPL